MSPILFPIHLTLQAKRRIDDKDDINDINSIPYRIINNNINADYKI